MSLSPRISSRWEENLREELPWHPATSSEGCAELGWRVPADRQTDRQTALMGSTGIPQNPTECPELQGFFIPRFSRLFIEKLPQHRDYKNAVIPEKRETVKVSGESSGNGIRVMELGLPRLWDERSTQIVLAGHS